MNLLELHLLVNIFVEFVVGCVHDQSTKANSQREKHLGNSGIPNLKIKMKKLLTKPFKICWWRMVAALKCNAALKLHTLRRTSNKESPENQPLDLIARSTAA